MISSMTGYGKSVVQENGTLVETEIKSLNNRFLDLSIKLPKNLYNKELEIREKIKSRISRGKIYLTITVTKEGIEQKFAPYNSEGVKYALDVLKEVKETAGLTDEITLADLLNFQTLFFDDNDAQDNDDIDLVLQSIGDAIIDLEKMRKDEGAELQKDLTNRINLIGEYLTKIEGQVKNNTADYFNRIKERAKVLFADLVEYPDRLSAELALITERYDVTEECVRLRSHLKMFNDTLIKSDDAGRRLNFIVQEMNREANTINSKSISSDVSHLGIMIKEELEKIREQIQNIE